MHGKRIWIAALIFELSLIGLSPAPPDSSNGPVSINMTIATMTYFSAPLSSLTLTPPGTGTTWTGTISGCEYGCNDPGGFDLIATDETNDGFLKNVVNGEALANELDMKCGIDPPSSWKSLSDGNLGVVSLHQFDQGEYNGQSIDFQQVVDYADKPGTYEGTITFAISYGVT